MEEKSFIHMGRMNAPTASAWQKGLCGDEMEFYLDIDTERDIIREVKFYSPNGCSDTFKAGECVAAIVENKSIIEALKINPYEIIKAENAEISEGGRHCVILAVTTFFKAVADYMLQP